MWEFEPIIMPNGKTISVKTIYAKNRRMVGRLENDCVIIKVPIRWDDKYARECADKIYGNIKRRLLRHPEIANLKRRQKSEFKNNDNVSALGMNFHISVVPCETLNKKSYAKLDLDSNSIIIRVPSSYDESKNRQVISRLARKVISTATQPILSEIVWQLNSAHFSSRLGRIRIRDNLNTWGSCSKDNNITINFKLLLMERQFLDYVIIHELAHTKIRNHSSRFWKEVERTMPQYAQVRQELRKL